MNSPAFARLWTWDWRWGAVILLAVLIGLNASAVAGNPVFWIGLAGLVLYGLLLWESIRNPMVFVFTFLAVLILLPPFFFRRTGENPVFVSTLLAPVGLAVIVVRWQSWSRRLDSIGKGLLTFLVGIGLSLPFAFVLSGDKIGWESLFRWLMLAQMGLVYWIIRTNCSGTACARIIPWLIVAAVIAAAYGIFDFFWPVPIPHPSADQYIWSESAVIRRAQGVFYESCNFANFCGFFLLVTAGAVLTGRERLLRIRRIYLLLFIVVLALAVLFAFSRSAWGSLLLSLSVLVLVSGRVRIGRTLLFSAALGIPLLLVGLWTPEIWHNLVAARIGSFSQILIDPDSVSSGRLSVWARVVSILFDNPQYLVFGIGYKTLPFTRLFHGEIITDNGYLSLLLESGILGLVGFLAFSRSVLGTFLSLARSARGTAAFWSALLFSLWCGEIVQMLAADAHTYWRNLIVYTALMACTLNMSESESGQQASALAEGSA
ncbi:MAG TPA: O-antigen ligase family protein [Terriglobia bacterium]|nr:O-antigen ligase family protein [Terriglobia bacterium]